MLKRQDVALQERLLRLGAVRDVERPRGMRQPLHEHPDLHQLPGDGHVELPEVNLRLAARLMGLRDEHLGVDQIELNAAAGDVPRDRHLRQGRAVLGYQSLPHPPGGVPLLPRNVFVRDKPGVDHPRPRVCCRPRPRHILLTWRR